MIHRYSVFLLLCLFSSVLSRPSPAISRQILCDSTICIHYSPVDSTHARQALRILATARIEICADFRIVCRDTVHVVIASSRLAFRRHIEQGLPEWAHAFALPGMRTMVVRSPRWDRPEASFRQALVHELIHLVLYQQRGGRALPRWIDEGLALFYAEQLQWENRTLLSKALATGSLIPLQDIDNVLQFARSSADLAYQQSYSAVRYLLATYDIDAMRHIIAGYQAGEDMDALFLQATGSTMSGFEQEWLNHLEETQKWYWLTESDELIWLGIPVLFLLAVFALRRRNRRRLAQWQAEEAIAATLEALEEHPPDAPEEDTSSANSY